MRNYLNSKTLIIFSIFILFFSKNSFSEEFISTNDVLQRIERILSNPDQGIIKDRKSTISINKTNQEINPQINISVDKALDDKNNRNKEKLAYNATLSGQYEVSRELYKQILKSEKNNNYAKFGLALSYHKLKQFKQAKRAYFDLLFADIDNKDEVISNLLEIIVEESPKDAKYVLARLSSQSANADYILARSALTYDKLKNSDEAILLLKRAIALNSNKVDYKMNLAIILDKSDNKTEALKYYKEVLQDYVKSGISDSQIDLASVKTRIDFIEKNY